MNCAAIITAGGLGTRMGSNTPKQYLEIGGIPILARTIAVYDRHPLISSIVVTVPENYMSYCKDNIIDRYGFSKACYLVTGGASRQKSVFNGLMMVKDADLVAIHDGVRPFVSESVISSALECATNKGACVVALPVSETVKRKTGKILKTISRKNLWLARTPQVFRTALIREAHRNAIGKNLEVTDDAALVEHLGMQVGIVKDSFYNLKITNPEDMNLAEIIASLPEFAISLNVA